MAATMSYGHDEDILINDTVYLLALTPQGHAISFPRQCHIKNGDKGKVIGYTYFKDAASVKEADPAICRDGEDVGLSKVFQVRMEKTGKTENIHRCYLTKDVGKVIIWSLSQ